MVPAGLLTMLLNSEPSRPGSDSWVTVLTVAGGEIHRGSLSVGSGGGGVGGCGVVVVVVVRGGGDVEGRRYLFLSRLKAMGRRVGFQNPSELNVIDPDSVCGCVEDAAEDAAEYVLTVVKLGPDTSAGVSVVSKSSQESSDQGSSVVVGRRSNVPERRLEIRSFWGSSCTTFAWTLTVVL